MARVGKYQALGRSLGQYKKTLYDVGAKEYQKQARKAEGEFQRGMYSAVGTTIANLAGIAQERAALKKLEPLDPGERPEVPIETETIDELSAFEMQEGSSMEDIPLPNPDDKYQPMTAPDPAPKPGSIMSSDTNVTRRGDDAFKKGMDAVMDFSGDSSNITSPIGLDAQEGAKNIMDFRNQEAQKNEQRAQAQREANLTEDSAYGISGVSKQTESGGLPQSAFDAMQDDPPLTYEEARTKSREARGIDGQGRVRGADDEKVRAERLGITVEQLRKDEAAAAPAGQQVVVPTGSNRASYATQIVPTVGTEDSQWKYEDMVAGYGKDVRNWNVDPEYTVEARKEAAMLSEAEAQVKQWDAEDKAMFGALKEEDNFNPFGGTNGKDPKSTSPLSKSGLQGDSLTNATKAWMLESSGGKDKNVKAGNEFQIKNKSLRERYNNEYGGKFTPENSAKFYDKVTSEFTGESARGKGTSFENMDASKAGLGNRLAGKTFNVYEEAAKAIGTNSKDVEGYIKYLTWNQGRKGALDIITSTIPGGKGGTLSKTSIAFMKNNVSASQWNEIQGKGSPSEMAKEFLKVQYGKWSKA